MKCKTLHKKLILYLENDLPVQEAEEVKIHLEQCTDCAAFAEYIRKTLNVLQEEKSPEVNPFFFTRLKARMEKEKAVPGRRVIMPAWGKILEPVVFSLLLLAGIYTGIKIGQPVQSESPYNVYAYQEIVPYINEMESEPIEKFLMEQNDSDTE